MLPFAFMEWLRYWWDEDAESAVAILVICAFLVAVAGYVWYDWRYPYNCTRMAVVHHNEVLDMWLTEYDVALRMPVVKYHPGSPAFDRNECVEGFRRDRYANTLMAPK